VEIRKIGVVGAGQMGTGITLACALAGFDVLLVDISAEALETAKETLAAKLSRRIEKGEISESDKADALKLVSTSETYDPLDSRDFVIEAVTENEQTKKDVIKTLCGYLSPNALIATNTSSISVTRLAAQTDRPGRFLGMHFMNPAAKLKLVELIRGIATEAETFETIRALTVKLGKTPVSAEDFPAFIVNRIVLPMINEAVYTLYEGVANVEAIDTAMKLGTLHPMGPLELADFIGLDTCLAVMNTLHEGLADTKYRPCPLLVKYVEAGWLGRKTGRGFYDYSGDKPVPTR
jgi:3-hydroxybutyryl-CoA dehydrogenase